MLLIACGVPPCQEYPRPFKIKPILQLTLYYQLMIVWRLRNRGVAGLCQARSMY